MYSTAHSVVPLYRVPFKLNVICAECHYAECRYAECHHAECGYAMCHYAKCHLD
jgi:hypothetical protein